MKLRESNSLFVVALIVIAAAVFSPEVIRATSVGDFSALMDRKVNLNDGVTVHDGLLGVNSNAGNNSWIGEGGVVNGVRVDGNFRWADHVTVRGDVVANGRVGLGSDNQFQGDVMAGDRVSGGSRTSISGDLIGADRMGLDTDLGVGGDIQAQGNISDRSGGWGGGGQGGGGQGGGGLTVGGDVVSGGSVNLTDEAGVAGDILDSGSSPPGSPVMPTGYTPVTLPEETSFSAGNDNVTVGPNDSLALAPGNYKNLTMNAGSTLTLSAGDYVLREWQAGGAEQALNLDVSQGNINIYLEEGADLGNMAIQLNGVDLDDVGETELSAADRVSLETHGDFTLEGSGSEWAGSIYAPDRRIEFSDSDTTVLGNLLGKELDMGKTAISTDCKVSAQLPP